MVKTAVPCQDQTILEQYWAVGTATSLGLVLSPESREFLDTNFILLNKIRNGQIIQMVFYLNKISENVKIIQRNNKLIYFCCKANTTVKLVKLI